MPIHEYVCQECGEGIHEELFLGSDPVPEEVLTDCPVCREANPMTGFTLPGCAAVWNTVHRKVVSGGSFRMMMRKHAI